MGIYYLSYVRYAVEAMELQALAKVQFYRTIVKYYFWESCG